MKSFGRHGRTLIEEQATIDELLNCMRVDIHEGKCYWTVDRGARAKAGNEAGCVNHKGYTHIKFNGKSYRRHRIVFYVANGFLPEIVDHKKGVCAGDGIDNLQEATNLQNSIKRKSMKNNTSGYRGVNWHSRDLKWNASIRIDGVLKHLGSFLDPVSAAKAYNDAAIQHFGKFAVLNEIPVDLSGE